MELISLKIFQWELLINEMINRACSIGANAVVGVKVDVESLGFQMLMVTATGTAVGPVIKPGLTAPPIPY